MSGNKVLLDTNIISALLKGESLIADHIDDAEETYIPSIVIGELYYGADTLPKLIKTSLTLSDWSIDTPFCLLIRKLPEYLGS